MKYSLRSLMIVVILAPPLLAGGWHGYQWLFPPAPPELRELSIEELTREFWRIWNLNAKRSP
jgi:hypothetical protein